MKRLFTVLALMGLIVCSSQAQRVTDKLDRGIAAVPVAGNTYFVSWRKFGSEYYDTKYNLYRNGTLIASNLEVSNFTVSSGAATDTYQVAAVVRGVEQSKSTAVSAWANGYLDVPVQPVVNRAGKTIANSTAGNSGGSDTTTSGYTLNDISLADVDGDGICEFIVKRNNSQGNLRTPSNTTDFNHYECYKIDGTRLWWIDLGPNLMSNPDEQYDMIGYDWDMDGKAECVMRAADNMIIHTATGKTINIGDMTVDSGSGKSERPEYVATGAEYLLYLNGATGEPYGWDGESSTFTPEPFPLPRFESNETVGDANVWGDVGHRATKIYMGAPYLDGRKPSIFFGRGCYTRHKACALDVDPATHQITQRWRWNCYDSKSPWYGNGFHNFAIADVDLDGRDEIVYGSMILDDTGFGLATTGLGHGDAQHCTDHDPYRWGLEQFTCQEGSQGNSYWNATTGEMYYRKGDGGDDGRAMAGNFTNDYPGSQGRSASSGSISLTADKVLPVNGITYYNMRIYWDGDLLDEMFDSKNGANRPGGVFKWNGSGVKTFEAITNNWTKCNPSAQGDILGDWREEVVLRTATNDALRIYTTTISTQYPIYTLWDDHVYRNGMAWQCVGYNQPPQTSFFLGELDGITIAPPPTILQGRTEVANGGTITTTDNHLLISGYEDKTIAVQEGASPYILTVNAPAWVQGTGSQQATSSTPKQPARNIINYTTTLTGGAFAGATRLVKQGEGTLVLPNVTEKHTGATDVWNGTLQFDGTFESSPLWLNRHTTLLSNGGKFLGGLKADYNATIYPGGKDNVGNITTSTLSLGFGSRIVFDVNSTNADQIAANKLEIEAKTDNVWLEYGPKYKSPIFQIAGGQSLADGKYLLGTIAEVTGDLNEIVIEGVDDKVHSLSLEDGKLYLVLGTPRQAGDIVWNGTATDSQWDFGFSENFLIGTTPTYAAIGDNVIFNDDAASTAVQIKGAVRPASVTFNNATKAYTVSLDSIVGGAPIVKNGAAMVTLNNVNHTGATTINAGKLSVSLLANKVGQAYGALGDISKSITINNGATLQANGIILTDQPINVDGTATIEVPSGKTFTTNTGIKGAGAIVKKTGAGTMTIGTGSTFSKLIISNSSRVNASQSNFVDDLPEVVEFSDGILWGDNKEDGNGITNNTNFVVPADKTGTFYASYRGYVNGTLTGSGTFKPISGGVRCWWRGDWSAFEGTIQPGVYNRQNKKTYDPVFEIANDHGFPKATLQLDEGMTIYSHEPNNGTAHTVEVGHIMGTGTLAGKGTYIIGGLNKDIFTGFYATAPIIKRGTGYWEPTQGNITGAVTIEEGTLRFNDTSLSTNYMGGAVTLKDKGVLTACGILPSLTIEEGGIATPRSKTTESARVLSIAGQCNVKEGGTIQFLLKSTTWNKDSNPGNSQLRARFLTVNGTVKTKMLSAYTPKAGDEFTLWKATSSFSGTPKFDLPELPAGLEWDTSGMTKATGVLKVVASTGIKGIGADAAVSGEVFTLKGVRVGQVQGTRKDIPAQVRALGVQPGTYIVRMTDGSNTGSETIVVR